MKFDIIYGHFWQCWVSVLMQIHLHTDTLGDLLQQTAELPSRSAKLPFGGSNPPSTSKIATLKDIQGCFFIAIIGSMFCCRGAYLRPVKIAENRNNRRRLFA